MHEIGFWPDYGYVLQGNVEDAFSWLLDMHCIPALIVGDPPYGDILPKADWKDKAHTSEWIGMFSAFEEFKCPIYWWGGIGKPNNRPFFQFILDVERFTKYRMRDLITWKKKRAYGKPNDYLFVREECAIFTYEGAPPPYFKIPLLNKLRGYEGYDKGYARKSKYLRRGNVWDETELLSKKLHVAHKAPIVCRIPIEVNTRKNELVLDLYSGSGELSVQAARLGRRFIAVEQSRDMCIAICKRIEKELGFDENPPSVEPVQS